MTEKFVVPAQFRYVVFQGLHKPPLECVKESDLPALCRAEAERAWRWFMGFDPDGDTPLEASFIDYLATRFPEAAPETGWGTRTVPCERCAGAGCAGCGGTGRMTEIEGTCDQCGSLAISPDRKHGHKPHCFAVTPQPSAEPMTFDALVAYGRKHGTIVNGMPWAFVFHNMPVTHESDTCYLLTTKNAGTIRFEYGDTLELGNPGEAWVRKAPTRGVTDFHAVTPSAEHDRCEECGHLEGHAKGCPIVNRPPAPVTPSAGERCSGMVDSDRPCVLRPGHAGKHRPFLFVPTPTEGERGTANQEHTASCMLDIDHEGPCPKCPHTKVWKPSGECVDCGVQTGAFMDPHSCMLGDRFHEGRCITPYGISREVGGGCHRETGGELTTEQNKRAQRRSQPTGAPFTGPPTPLPGIVTCDACLNPMMGKIHRIGDPGCGYVIAMQPRVPTPSAGEAGVNRRRAEAANAGEAYMTLTSSGILVERGNQMMRFTLAEADWMGRLANDPTGGVSAGETKPCLDHEFDARGDECVKCHRVFSQHGDGVRPADRKPEFAVGARPAAAVIGAIWDSPDGPKAWNGTAWVLITPCTACACPKCEEAEAVRLTLFGGGAITPAEREFVRAVATWVEWEAPKPEAVAGSRYALMRSAARKVLSLKDSE